jgi:hypothetical protein
MNWILSSPMNAPSFCMLNIVIGSSSTPTFYWIHDLWMNHLHRVQLRSSNRFPQIGHILVWTYVLSLSSGKWQPLSTNYRWQPLPYIVLKPEMNSKMYTV